MKFSSLVSEVGQWSEYNFRDNSGLRGAAPFLGVVEELFEEYPAAKSEKAVQDAFADAIIFLADCFYRFEIPADKLSFDNNHRTITRQQLDYMIGRTAKVTLKYFQQIRRTDKEVLNACYRMLFRYIVGLYYLRNGGNVVPMDELVSSIWAEVSKRDWKKFPINGKTE